MLELGEALDLLVLTGDVAFVLDADFDLSRDIGTHLARGRQKLDEPRPIVLRSPQPVARGDAIDALRAEHFNRIGNSFAASGEV